MQSLKAFVGDVLATGFWAARISEISEDYTVLILGAGPTGICTLLCCMRHHPKRIILCEKSAERQAFIRKHYPQVLVTTPEQCKDFVLQNSDHGGADRVLEVAGGEKTGGVDGCDCEEILRLIEERKIDTTPLITHRYPLSKIEEAYRLFENKEDGVIKIAIYNE